MVADGHADGELSLGVGGDEFAVLAADGAVDGKLYTLHGIVGAGVVYVSAHGERTYVLEVDAVVDECRIAHVACGIGGRELVDALGGNNHVGGSFAGEWHAANRVVALQVGVSEESELVLGGEHSVGGNRRRTQTAVVAVRHSAGLGVVVGGGLAGDALVDSPVGEESLLGAYERVVVVLQNFGLRESLAAEHAHFVDIAAECIARRRGVAAAQADAGALGRIETRFIGAGARECGQRIDGADAGHGGDAAGVDSKRERGEGVCRQEKTGVLLCITLLQHNRVAVGFVIGSQQQLHLAAKVEDGGRCAFLQTVGADKHLYGISTVGEVVGKRRVVESEEHTVARTLGAQRVELCDAAFIVAGAHQGDACTVDSRARTVGNAAGDGTQGTAEAVVHNLLALFIFTAGDNPYHLVVVVLSGQCAVVLVEVVFGGAAGLVERHPFVLAFHRTFHFVPRGIDSNLVYIPRDLYLSVLALAGRYGGNPCLTGQTGTFD